MLSGRCTNEGVIVTASYFPYIWLHLTTHQKRKAVARNDQKWYRKEVFITNQKQMRTQTWWEHMKKVMSNTDSHMAALYTTSDLTWDCLPTVNKQHSPPHHSWNSYTVQPGHPPGQSVHYWMPAKQVSDPPAGSGDIYSERWRAARTDHYTMLYT